MVGTLSTREGLDFKFAVLDIVPCADKGGGTACLSMELLNPALAWNCCTLVSTPIGTSRHG